MPPPRLSTLPRLRSPFHTIHHPVPLLLRSPHHLLLLRSPHLLLPGHPHHQPLQSRQTRTFLTPLLQSTSTALTTLSEFTAPLTTTGHPPWYLLLPLSALLIRTITVLPLTLYARKVCIRLINLAPLTSAWGRVISTAIVKEKHGPPITPFQWEKLTRAKAKLKEKELQKLFRCERWKAYLPMLQIPLWVVASLTLRGMTTEASSITAARNESLPPLPSEEVTEVVAASSALIPGYMRTLLDSIPLEESFSHGGALWFPDLLAPDPLYLLPVMLSITMFANIEFQSLQYPSTTNRGRIVRSLLRMFALGVIPVTMQTPVALTLYWLSSSMYSLVQNIVLHYVHPMPKAVTPCKPKSLIGFEEQEKPSISSN